MQHLSHVQRLMKIKSFCCEFEVRAAKLLHSRVRKIAAIFRRQLLAGLKSNISNKTSKPRFDGVSREL